MKHRFLFYIDVVGACNLTCPSCPVGNSPSVPMAKGVMSADLLRRVMEKAVAECDVESVALFNWTEPLLHREIADLVRIVQGFDVPCDLSSNLNVLRDPDTTLAVTPVSRVSVSGFNQAAAARPTAAATSSA
jgi:MoaA/NifB/PqqE/SkfB family radical SAM enzyme